jgi:hypothetical protein
MRWPVDGPRLAQGLSWVALVLAVAAYGAAIVRNVTEALVGITTHQTPDVVVQRPNR